ncbi:MAG: class I SAM-dependent methyltransferase [Chloroflexota bacterium]
MIRQRRPQIERDEARVIKEYRRREDDEHLAAYYRRVGPALAALNERRRHRLASLLNTIGVPRETRVLDVGCGDGGDLHYLATKGWDPNLLAGVDVFPASISRAARMLPEAQIEVANAAALPFDDGSFDATIQCTVLSSIVDAAVRFAVVEEMFRVTRAGGVVISWDMKAGGSNPHLVGIDQMEIARLFAPWSRSRVVNRATPTMILASRLPSWMLPVLERLPFALTHLVVVAQKDRSI